ncbi:MAG: phosphate signaling complex protein PhoU [Prevotella sp.]|jgi:phosphate transport system protein|nr:phosphate signaling complex protein PhoU [Prevotella sp.]MCH4182601.1 phosphate signaling complex protein PhoU [Prevotella sp.]MCH4212322.1 phosphate signaling complex protein PhoU [Prevotella sp.]MCH4240306.1 phosphate signaling complex protein PhoU [Prevotella sp.]
MVKFIEEELMTIRKEILDMWALVYDQIKTVCEAIPTADKKKAWKVLIREKRVNASELKIDCDVEDFLVLYNPVAIDLRFALAMLKMNADLERIGDFAEGISRFIIKDEGEEIPDPELLKKLRLNEMVEQVLSMLDTARQALIHEDLELANSLFSKDNIVDEINSNVSKILADYVHDKPEKAQFCFDLKSVFLKLERAGDHTTNLDEEIIFYIDAKVLKHSYDNSKSDEAINHVMNEGEN